MDLNDTSTPLRILLVEDNEHDWLAFRRAFQKSQVASEIRRYVRAEEALERLDADASSFDLVVTDYKLPGMSGLELCQALLEREVPLPLVLLTGAGTECLAVEALKEGVDDYLIKDPNRGYLALLPVVLPDVVRKHGDHLARQRAEQALKEYSERLEEMVEQRTQELREAQEQLVRQEKLAVLGQLAGGVGHELRNPLAVIKNTAYFLNMVLKEPEPEVKEALDIVDKEVGICNRTISSLLDFARAEPPVRRKVDVNDIVQAALSRITIPDNIEVVSQPDASVPAILADPDQLAQVFGNITLNGIQAMPEGGRLVVKTLKTSEASGKPPRSEWVAVSFTDTGVGIPAENLGKLFEPLFTTKAKGIGLGLVLVESLVEANGGSIEVQSEVGKGSTFTVILPLAVSGSVHVESKPGEGSRFFVTPSNEKYEETVR
jgi:signal transduction histidine kinase